MENLKLIPLALFVAFLVHESSHYLAARLFSKRLNFRFSWGRLWKIPVPRYVWTMPYMERWKQRVVALAGFGVELLGSTAAMLFDGDFAFWYVVVVFAHLFLYKFYAGEDSDFKWVT